jgi:hypothetical protein
MLTFSFEDEDAIFLLHLVRREREARNALTKERNRAEHIYQTMTEDRDQWARAGVHPAAIVGGRYVLVGEGQ